MVCTVQRNMLRNRVLDLCQVRMKDNKCNKLWWINKSLKILMQTKTLVELIRMVHWNKQHNLDRRWIWLNLRYHSNNSMVGIHIKWLDLIIHYTCNRNLRFNRRNWKVSIKWDKIRELDSRHNSSIIWLLRHLFTNKTLWT